MAFRVYFGRCQTILDVQILLDSHIATSNRLVAPSPMSSEPIEPVSSEYINHEQVCISEGTSSAITEYVDTQRWQSTGEIDEFASYRLPETIRLEGRTIHLPYQGREFNVIIVIDADLISKALRPCEDRELLESLYGVPVSESRFFLDLLVWRASVSKRLCILKLVQDSSGEDAAQLSRLCGEAESYGRDASEFTRGLDDLLNFYVYVSSIWALYGLLSQTRWSVQDISLWPVTEQERSKWLVNLVEQNVDTNEAEMMKLTELVRCQRATHVTS